MSPHSFLPTFFISIRNTMNGNEKLRVSVCITSYNRPELLERSLLSLAQQTLPPDEVLVFDDFSPKDPTAHALRCAHHFKRFDYRRHKENLGMPGNLNSIISAASGEYVVNLHDADIYEPELIRKWVSLMDENSSIGFAFCGYGSTGAEGRVWVHKDIARVTNGIKFFREHFLLASSSKIWGTVIGRRSAYLQLLPFDKKYGPWADVDMWMRMCQQYNVGYLAEALINLDSTSGKFRGFSWRVPIYTYCMKAEILEQSARGGREKADLLFKERRLLALNLVRYLLGRIKRTELRSAALGVQLLFLVVIGSSSSRLMSRVERA